MRPDRIRERIRQTASVMFCRNGFKTVSIEDICYKLGIAKKTFYVEYSNKGELVHEFVETVFFDVFRSLEKYSMPDAVSKLKTFDRHLVDFFKIFYPVLISDLKRYHHECYQVFADKREILIGYLVVILESGKQQGVFRETSDSPILAELRFDELEIMFSKQVELKVPDWNRSHKELFEHYLAGLMRETVVVDCGTD